MPSLTALRNLEPEQIQSLVDRAAELKKAHNTGKIEKVERQATVGLLFFEDSTRTRISFEQAAAFLGHRYVNFSQSGSSLSKGESLKDTIITLSNSGLDIMVIRHRCAGTPLVAERYFSGPIISAGDGQHEHPTQGLGDALTILERKGGIDGLKVAIVGDVKHSRVARSDAWCLSKLGAEIRFVGPRTLMPGTTPKLPGKIFYDLASGIEGADVVICLRLQKERMNEGLLASTRQYSKLYQINRNSIKHAADDVLIMHPGPLNRGIELDDWAADGPQSAIAAQVENKVFVCMAAIEWALGRAPIRRKAKVKAS